MNHTQPYKAVVLGAAGKVGKALIKKLLRAERCTQLTVVSRQPVAKHPKLHNEVWSDFSAFWNKQSSELTRIFAGADVLFCCMGGQPISLPSHLWQRRQAAKMYQSVDYYYIVGSAAIAQLANVPQLSLISSPKAAKKAPLLISKIQWKMQEEVKNMGFPGVSIFQPGYLVDPVDRNNSTWNLLWQQLKVSWHRMFHQHRELIAVDDVASAMKLEYELRLAGQISDTACYHSEDMRKLLLNHPRTALPL